MNRKVLFLILLFFSIVFSISADKRTENIDVFLVLDKSLSMVEEIESVKAYVSEKLIEKLLIPGDTFTLIPFFGKASVVYSGSITSSHDLKFLTKEIQEIKADGHFTDIGNALDTLKNTLKNKAQNSRRKYLLLITDGKQEAPPESIYYSPDHSFNHEFLKNVKIIQKEGWKIEILGIGTMSAAKELARELSGSYTEVSDGSTADEIEKKVGNFLGIVRIENKCTIKDLKKTGNGNLTFTLVSEEYKESVAITISKIFLTANGIDSINILNQPAIITVQPGKKETVSLNINVPLKDDSYNGEITFMFDKGNSFLPAVQKIQISSVANYSLILYIIVVVLLVAGITIFILRHHVPSKKDEDEEIGKVRR